MYTVSTRKQFRKDFKRFEGNPGRNIEVFKETVRSLCMGKTLPESRRDHSLTGQYKGCRECHLAPDWLLVYMIDETEKRIVLIRIGSHSDLF